MSQWAVVETSYGWAVKSTDGRAWPCKDRESADAALASRVTSQPACVECGDPVVTWMDQRAEKMLAERLCSSCIHWRQLVAEFDANTAVINGHRYQIGEDERSVARRCRFPLDARGRLRSDYRHVLGCGGSECVIEFFDGRRVETTNLWGQGAVPDHFRERLPDNARFVRSEPGRYCGSGAPPVVVHNARTIR